MKIKHKQIDQNKYNINAIIDKSIVGILTYSYIDNETILADHTYITPQFRSKGIAGELFNFLIDFAQENNLKIKSTCSYISKKFEANEELQYLLAKK